MRRRRTTAHENELYSQWQPPQEKTRLSQFAALEKARA